MSNRSELSEEVVVQDKSGSSRILALDLLRGYFILVIASIHLAYLPSLLGTFDGRGQLWFSEAEGFFFISGLITGIIRRKNIVRSGLWTATRKTWARAGTLYTASVVLTLAYVAMGRLLTAHGVMGVKTGLDATGSWLHILLQTLLLQYSYGWTDFLVYYAAFLFITPAALWLLSKRLWPLVLLASIGIWFWHWTGVNVPGPFTSFMLWQGPFFLGLVVGYHWDNILGHARSLTSATRRRLSSTLIWVTATLFLASTILVIVAEYFMKFPSKIPDWASDVISELVGASQDHDYNRLLNDARGGLLRPLVLIIFMAGLYALVRRYEAQIMRWVGWLLVPFGRNSLYVYIVQSVLLFAVPLLVSSGSFFLNTAIEIGITAATWYAVRRKFLFGVIPR